MRGTSTGLVGGKILALSDTPVDAAAPSLAAAPSAVSVGVGDLPGVVDCMVRSKKIKGTFLRVSEGKTHRVQGRVTG